MPPTQTRRRTPQQQVAQPETVDTQRNRQPRGNAFAQTRLQGGQAGQTGAGTGAGQNTKQQQTPVQVSGTLQNALDIVSDGTHFNNVERLSYLSASAPNPAASQDVRVFGSINVTGPADQTVSAVRLDVIQGGKVVTTANLDGERSGLVGKPLGQKGLNAQQSGAKRKSRGTADGGNLYIPLFRLGTTQLANINASNDGSLTLKVVVQTSGGQEASFSQDVQILTRYTGARYGQDRDPEEGGDDWTLPSVKTVVDHFASTIPGFSVNDMSHMNGGDTPDHQSHETGTSADFVFDGFDRFDKDTAARLADILHDQTYGSRVRLIYVTFGRDFGAVVEKWNKDNPNRNLNRVQNIGGHRDHFHMEVNPQATGG